MDQTPPQDADFEALPQHARERLVEMRGRDEAHRLFTSDLSTSEFLLVKEAGFDPVGLVVGSSIYHVGYQSAGWNKNQEMTVLTQAMYHARELAMNRMEEEANALGSDGIVGVRLEVNHKEWGNHIAEFVAIGTAVVHRGDPQRFRNKHNKPFTSDLSGQDFYILLRSGYRPLGMVMGNCVYHVAHQAIGSFMRNFTQNQELVQYTQALYDSRELAMERMQQEAEQLGAKGIVGANIHEHSHTWGSHVIEFFAVGTAVDEISKDHVIEAPTLVLPLIDWTQDTALWRMGSQLMETSPLHAFQQDLLARARALVLGSPPAPWESRAIVSAAGVLAAGWDDDENVVLISTAGYSVSAARTGTLLLRDRDEILTYAALSTHSQSFTLPHSERRISVFGLASGDGIHGTQDVWHFEIIYPWWPIATVLIRTPFVLGSGELGYLDRVHAIELGRLDDGTWVKCGFSPSGKHFMIIGSAGAEIYSR